MLIALVPSAWIAAADCPVGSATGCAPAEYCEAVFEPDGSCPAAGTCRPLPPAPEITLSLPVPAGGRVFCTQGTLGAGTATHSTCSEDRRELERGLADAPGSDVDFLRYADEVRRAIDRLARTPCSPSSAAVH